MLMLRGLVVIAAIAVWLYCVFDVIRAEAGAVHHLHKLVWLVFVLLIPLLGAPTWLLLGRPQPLGSRLFEAGARPLAPDDSPEFLSQIDDEIRRRRRAERRRAQTDEPAAIDDEIRRLEDELRRRSEEQPGDDPKLGS